MNVSVDPSEDIFIEYFLSSVDFAKLIFEEYYSKSSHSLLDNNHLSDQHILELGFVHIFISTTPSYHNGLGVALVF